MAAGSAPWNGGYANVDAGADHARLQRHDRPRRAASPTDAEPDVAGPSCTIELDLGLGDGSAELPDERPLLRLRPHQRGLPHMSRIVVKVGGAVASRVGGGGARARARATRSCVVHGAGPQISADMERAGIPVEFVGGRRVTTEAGIEIVRASLQAVNGDLWAALGPHAVPFFGYDVGLRAEPIPGARPRRRARHRRSSPLLRRMIEPGKLPGDRAARRRPAERERRRRRRRDRGRRARRRAALPDRRRGLPARRRGRRLARRRRPPRICTTAARSTRRSCRSSAPRSPPRATASRAFIGRTEVEPLVKEPAA